MHALCGHYPRQTCRLYDHHRPFRKKHSLLHLNPPERPTSVRLRFRRNPLFLRRSQMVHPPSNSCPSPATANRHRPPCPATHSQLRTLSRLLRELPSDNEHNTIPAEKYSPPMDFRPLISVLPSMRSSSRLNGWTKLISTLLSTLGNSNHLFPNPDRRISSENSVPPQTVPPYAPPYPDPPTSPTYGVNTHLNWPPMASGSPAALIVSPSATTPTDIPPEPPSLITKAVDMPPMPKPRP